MTAATARALLGVERGADAQTLRKAFREAAKRAHPDRPGGSPALFRDMLAAHRVLQTELASPIAFPPAVQEAAAPPATGVTITPLIAVEGGQVEIDSEGRRLRITLPAGLREDDRIRVDGLVLSVSISGDAETLVRGDDLWLTAAIDPQVLADGGRAVIDTPVGRRSVWITQKAAERGLIRVSGQGLPARGDHPQGDLFLRVERAPERAESPARMLLKRFTAAWAA